MENFGIGLILIGVLMALAGVGGFMDTRKVDRRFRTGYKNNEPDTRNFGRSGKILMYGVGVCIIGAAINNYTHSDRATSSASNDASQVAPTSTATIDARADQSSSSSDVVKLDPNQRQSLASNGADTDSLAQASPIVSQANRSLSAGRADEASTSMGSRRSFETSFDCNLASHDDEVAICGDAGLAAMDKRLGQLYDATMKTIADPDALRQSEAEWVGVRHGCNSDLDCLRHAYGERIGQFLGSVGSKPLIATNSPSVEQ
ncbi:lysozyme inhibitor LprI family protein [Burkholderia gladioli]|uniref:lysozyme inhibitor LprI family protein n=1 Tax=Burkholderia gladioli TaxID=28095 RepID=UPI00163E4694|nr:hypothetical protein [Burkholderia gladioli]